MNLFELCKIAILYGSDTWCLQGNEMAILKKTVKAMITGMCGVKLIEKRSSQKLIDFAGIEKKLWKSQPSKCNVMV